MDVEQNKTENSFSLQDDKTIDNINKSLFQEPEGTLKKSKIVRNIMKL